MKRRNLKAEKTTNKMRKRGGKANKLAGRISEKQRRDTGSFDRLLFYRLF